MVPYGPAHPARDREAHMLGYLSQKLCVLLSVDWFLRSVS
jgi:hypothetical protein